MAPWGQTGEFLLANFSELSEKTTLEQFLARLKSRFVSKNEPNQCTLQEIIAKKTTVPIGHISQKHHIRSKN